ncbi:hypothetical protein Klosneuvirus_1_307 [Klosneuvirus KNV1]|uniref:Uncharacterized protein n=1 Tax=Klosneuvirus KNV1 TaxID=1977640 RepID=A0A1V0SIA2_9VIRU|nr:hypothetical protein Klosneuvirus_1_307 [Klosneuvirus KNV1]
MITPDDFESVYQYVPAPRMPGVRKIGSVPNEKYRLAVNLDAEPLNFVPAHASKSGCGCGERCRRRPPVMAAGGIGVEPFEVKINTGFLSTLLILILIVWLVYNTSNK